jgi:hypothetical protein
MESPEKLNPLQQFKFDLRSLVTKLSALKDLSSNFSQEDFAKHKSELDKLDEILEDYKTGISDDELVDLSELLDQAEMHLRQIGEENGLSNG